MSSPVSASSRSSRARLRRFHERGHYDRQTLLEVLDAGIVCHIAFVHRGQPVTLPTLYWHDEEAIYVHGSAASRMLESCMDADVCVSVAHLDGLVLTKSAFHHSANYRSATIFGKARLVSAMDDVATQLRAMMERLFPGRWERLRPVKLKELKATKVLAIPLSEASAKIRIGPPSEDQEDLDWPAWSGVLPIRTVFGAAIPDSASWVGASAPACAIEPSGGSG